MNGQEFTIKIDELLDTTKEVYQQFAADTENWLRSSLPLVLAIDPDNTDTRSPAYQMDMALFRAAPVAVVPKHSEFFPLTDNGHRLLLTADGLYLEVRRPWLYFVHRLAEQTTVAMPFGRIEPRTDLAFGRLGNALGLIRAFAHEARQTPMEAATLIIWNNQENKLRELELFTSATAASVKYDIPPLEDHESIAIDLHSHASLPAFFSDTDNQDDAGSVKISGVLGNLDTPAPSVAFRLCVLGLYLPIAVPAAAIFEGA